MFKFINENLDGDALELTTEAVDSTDVCRSFMLFLLGAGFNQQSILRSFKQIASDYDTDTEDQT